eukprot:2178029-Prymnesium_polylepis.1
MRRPAPPSSAAASSSRRGASGGQSMSRSGWQTVAFCAAKRGVHPPSWAVAPVCAHQNVRRGRLRTQLRILRDAASSCESSAAPTNGNRVSPPRPSGMVVR